MQVSKNFLIIGATSAIAEATARRWVSPGATFYLLARNSEKMNLVSQDLRTRGAVVTARLLDVNDLESHEQCIHAAFQAMLHVDIVLLAHGDLPDQRLCEEDVLATLGTLNTNAVSVVSLLTFVANRMQAQGSGVIAVIGSVAGDRGRKSNYVYGSCKALVGIFTEGLAGRLKRFGVAVVTIKPGFVDTPMTAHIKKGLLWASADNVARVIDSRVRSAHSGTYYAPRFWWPIMLVVRSIPAWILYRLNL